MSDEEEQAAPYHRRNESSGARAYSNNRGESSDRVSFSRARANTSHAWGRGREKLPEEEYYGDHNNEYEYYDKNEVAASAGKETRPQTDGYHPEAIDPDERPPHGQPQRQRRGGGDKRRLEDDSDYRLENAAESNFDNSRRGSTKNSYSDSNSSDEYQSNHTEYGHNRGAYRSRSDDDPRRAAEDDGDRHLERRRSHRRRHRASPSPSRDRRADEASSRSHSRSRSRSGSRSRLRSRSRSRSRRYRHSHHRRRRRSGERSSYSDDSDYERSSSSRHQQPNSTIMVRGLPLHVTENDIMQDIATCSVSAKEVRVIRHRETGVSRGFAFVEFNSIPDASCWMDTRMGLLTFQPNFTASMIYTVNSSPFGSGSPRPFLTDWYCVNCQGHNFKRRDVCYRCRATRPNQEGGGEASYQPTCSVVLRNLDGLTQEEGVLQAFQDRPGLASIPMRSVRIGRDKTTNLSLGVCFVDCNNLSDAVRLHTSLKEYPLKIDEREVTVAYCKPPGQGATGGAVAKHAVQAGQWGLEKDMTKELSSSSQSQEEIQTLAESSAAHYARSPAEYAQYLQYYLDYYSRPQPQPPHESNSASSYSFAQEISQVNEQKGRDLLASASAYAESNYWNTPAQETVARATTNVLQGASKYADEQEFLGQGMPTTSSTNQSTANYSEQTASESADKLSEAKRIQKDMEKWAKSLKPKKDVKASWESPTASIAGIPDSYQRASGYANLPEAAESSRTHEARMESSLERLSRDQEHDHTPPEYVDKIKLACLLCKRQFSNPTQLEKHVELSDLHKQNLKAIGPASVEPFQLQSTSSVYRDRALERRKQFGLDKIESKNKIKDLYLQSKRQQLESESAPSPNPKDAIQEDNIGNKLLKKMGWNAGQGLGLRNQGRTDIIVAERRAANVGLGLKAVTDEDDDGNRYANPRKVTLARYQQLE